MLITGNTRFRNAVAASFLAALHAGCAELRWHKEAADAAGLERDLGECRQLARIQAPFWAWPHPGIASSAVPYDARGRPLTMFPYWMEIDRFMAERDLTRSCMRGRGYELVPADKPVTK